MQSGLYKGRKSYRYVKTAYTSSLKITECALKKGIDFLTFFCAGWSPFTELTGVTSTWTRKPIKHSGIIQKRRRRKKNQMMLPTLTDHIQCLPGKLEETNGDDNTDGIHCHPGKLQTWWCYKESIHCPPGMFRALWFWKHRQTAFNNLHVSMQCFPGMLCAL